MPIGQNIANPLPTSSQASQGARQTTNFTAPAQTLIFSVTAYSNVTITLHGTYGASTLHFQVSDDGGATYYDVNGSQNGTQTVVAASQAFTANTVAAVNFPVFGFTNFLITCTAIASGTLVIGATPTGDAIDPLAVISGTVTVSGTATIQGAKGNNTAAPSTTNIGAIAVLANAAAPSWTEGNLVLLSALLNGNLRTDATSYGGTAVVTGGVNGSTGVGGLAAQGASVAGSPVYVGAQARTTEQAAVTSGQVVAFIADAVGKQVIMPYATKENLVKGSATTTGTSDTSVVAAGSGSLKNYITGGTVYNSGSTTSVITVKDGSGGATLFTTIAPTGGGSNFTLPTPVSGTAATAVYFAAASASTTIGISLVGYTGA